MPTITIDRQMLERDLDALAHFGRQPGGGITRLALSREDAQARAYVRDRMAALGLALTADEVGNLRGRRPGARPDAPCVLTGSHLDSVPEGGRFDGPLGVLGALLAIEALDRAGVRTLRPIEAIVFVGEEGSRFRRGTLGSAAVSGHLPVGDILALTDASGTTFRDALAIYGDPRGSVIPARAARGTIAAFVELHVEQGGVLEARGDAVGIVESIAGLVQLVLRLQGVANHAGATPMDGRRDALCGAAELVLAVERQARETGGGAVATVGKLEAAPGAANIIPGEASLTVDLRAPERDLLDGLVRGVRDRCEAVARARRLELDVRERQRVEPGPMAPEIQAAIEEAAHEAGARAHRMPSGAIHDALHMAELCPAGMIFVPSLAGKSHCPEERSTTDQMAVGIEVLARTLARLAG